MAWFKRYFCAGKHVTESNWKAAWLGKWATRLNCLVTIACQPSKYDLKDLPMAWLKRCFRAGKLVTELLSAERLTGWVTEQSDWDLSWPLTFFAFVGGGDPGGELIEWSEDTECLARRCLVFPGSLRDISFRTAWGLAVPVNKRNDMIYKQNRSKHVQSKTKDFVKF